MTHAKYSAPMSAGEFSVCQFFNDGTCEYVRRWADLDEAMKAFRHYTNNVATRMGIVTRVIITDGGDCTCAEWQAGKGITFPPPAQPEDEEARQCFTCSTITPKIIECAACGEPVCEDCAGELVRNLLG